MVSKGGERAPQYSQITPYPASATHIAAHLPPAFVTVNHKAKFHNKSQFWLWFAKTFGFWLLNTHDLLNSNMFLKTHQK